MTGVKETPMSCAEFHKELPFIIESGGEIRHAHLASCENCSSLVQDLRYIADQAKLLLPMHDPSPRVWNNIQVSLSKDGLIANEQNQQRGHVAAQKKNNTFVTLGWAAAIAAAVLVAFTLFQTTRSVPSRDQIAQSSPPPGYTDQQDDAQLLQEVQQSAPTLAPVYESNLRNVNEYIADARATLSQDPNDQEARGHLREAYAQKAMLYRMGTTRLFQ